MKENIQHTSDAEEKQDDIFFEVPMEKKMGFQYFLMKEAGIERGEENQNAQNKWIADYAKEVSEILNCREDIRSLVTKGDYKGASEYVLPYLRGKMYN